MQSACRLMRHAYGHVTAHEVECGLVRVHGTACGRVGMCGSVCRHVGTDPHSRVDTWFLRARGLCRFDAPTLWWLVMAHVEARCKLI